MSCVVCEFCNNQEQKLIPDEDLEYIKEMLVDGNEVNSYSSVYLENDELYFDSSCKEYPHSKVKINFCPICGRDLRNENRENCEYLSLETIKSIYEKNVNMAKCKYAVCDYYDGKNVYCITDDLSEAEFECFVKIDHPGNVVYDLEKDEVVWEVNDLGLDDKTLELVTKLKRSWQTNE